MLIIIDIYGKNIAVGCGQRIQAVLNFPELILVGDGRIGTEPVVDEAVERQLISRVFGAAVFEIRLLAEGLQLIVDIVLRFAVDLADGEKQGQENNDGREDNQRYVETERDVPVELSFCPLPRAFQNLHILSPVISENRIFHLIAGCFLPLFHAA